MNCHQVKGQGVRIGPDLTGSGSNGSRYFIENIIDPNAVIGLDYQMSIIETKDDEIMSGIIEEKTDSSVTIRTLTDRVVVAQSEIESLDTSEQSMMPSGLLDTLNDREIVELLKFLRSI
jgi:putative heme-binding domain-containing protein